MMVVDVTVECVCDSDFVSFPNPEFDPLENVFVVFPVETGLALAYWYGKIGIDVPY
jgi:hypothetical protein